MNEAHENAAVGTALQRLKGVRAKLLNLDLEAKRLGNTFGTAGGILLSEYPEALVQKNTSFSGPSAKFAIDPADFERKDLVILIKDFRE
jgi:hypothetical protein